MAGARKGQEGSRWYNEPPSGPELAKWFEENVPIDIELAHKDYLPGVTLIPQTEKAKVVTGYNSEGQPLIAKRENLIFTPYAKVETRVKYFHDLMLIKEDDWLGVIEPVVPDEADPRLPPGFFSYFIPTGENVGQRYICCSMKVTVFERGSVEWKRMTIDKRTGEEKYIRVGKTIIDAPPATKMIPTTKKGWQDKIEADPFAMMKAETGAVGRALGLAGMLVIPGTGVATAEDMAEAEAMGSTPSLPDSEPVASVAPPSDPVSVTPEAIEVLRKDAIDAINKLKSEAPSAFKRFQEWAQTRGVAKVVDVEDAAILRGLTAKATKDLEESEPQKAGEAE